MQKKKFTQLKELNTCIDFSNGLTDDTIKNK